MNRRIWQPDDEPDRDYNAGEQSYDPFFGASAERDERGISDYGENPYGYHGQYGRSIQHGRSASGPRRGGGVEEIDISSGRARSLSGVTKRVMRYPPGPKGYRRSDERIADDICQRLSVSPEIDASEVTLHVHDGEVTLEGTVPQRYMKHAIDDLAVDCPGVKDVNNRIRVAPAAGQLR
jgi:osmotically-inducible protein OsmY